VRDEEADEEALKQFWMLKEIEEEAVRGFFYNSCDVEVAYLHGSERLAVRGFFSQFAT